MKPFRSPEEMLDAHEQMFGEAGKQCADVVLRWAGSLFDVPLDALNIRIVLAPVELGPYGRHAGYLYRPEEGLFILGNRNIVEFDGVSLILKESARRADRHIGITSGNQDFIVHELTHARQAQLASTAGRANAANIATKAGTQPSLKPVRAILASNCHPSIWPQGPRKKEGRLTEVEMTHWPMYIRQLAKDKDPRLPLKSSVDVQRFMANAAE